MIKKDFVRFCKIISVLRNASSCSYNFSLTLTYNCWLTIDYHAFNAPFSRRILGSLVRNPHCWKVFTNVFDCDQHSNLFLCESHKYHNAHSAHWSTPGGPCYSRFECSATARLQRRLAESDLSTGQWASRSANMITRDTSLCVGNSEKFRASSILKKNVQILLIFFRHPLSLIWGPRGADYILAGFKHYSGIFRWCSGFFRIEKYLDILRYF